MSGSTDNSAGATVKKALAEIRHLRAQLEAVESSEREPLAIVGVGLRLPGHVNNLRDYERLLWSGSDAISEIPQNRWSIDQFYDEDPDLDGHMTTRHGGFLDDIEDFDAEFFGIAPQEAASLDPQHRLVLETGWEALETAGINPETLRGSDTGIFLGISNSDYGRALFSDRDRIETYFGTGTAFSVAAGRLAYFLDTRGPALSIDTACSSSLVALHEACRSLRARECDLALAGGVNVILTPEMNITFSRGRMMASNGRCKTFDAAADGYVRGEGCGMFALQRLSTAFADGKSVLALIRGSAVNQDGRSGGLTAPNGPAQEAVIRSALQAADVDARDVAYVEAHGTGTPLGDPIEVGALQAVYGAAKSPRDTFCVGSAKTVIGHLEAAAGIAGAAKALLVLSRQEIPPHLNLTDGNPEIDWSAPLSVPTKATPLPPAERPLKVAVSSFGFSGTNAHLVMEQAPSVQVVSDLSKTPGRGTHLLTLSARSGTALQTLSQRYADRLREAADPEHLCQTANTGRAAFRHRLALTGQNGQDLIDAIDDFQRGQPNERAIIGNTANRSQPRIAFLFSGQGGHFAGAGTSLRDCSHIFRNSLSQASADLDQQMSVSLEEALFGDDAGQVLQNTAVAQPALVAMQCAMVDLCHSFGLVPSLVLGHSLGEYAAAYYAGLMTRRDAVLGGLRRGELLQSLGTGGAMAAIAAPNHEIANYIAQQQDTVGIAAFHGPNNTTISGPQDAIANAVREFEAMGCRARLLDVPFAAHSSFVEPVADAMKQAMSGVDFGAPKLPLVSTVTGSLDTSGEMANAAYWARNLREPVRFNEAVKALAEHNITHVIEIGPHPILLGLIEDSLPQHKLDLLGTLHRDRNDWSDILGTLGQLYADGSSINWKGLYDGSPSNNPSPSAPTYPFQRKRHWIDIRETTESSGPNTWELATSALDLQAERAPLDLNVYSYPKKWALFSEITIATARNTLVDARVFDAPSTALSLQEVQARLGADGIYRPLLRRWLDRLAGTGELNVLNDHYSAPAELRRTAMAQLWEEAEEEFSDNRPLLEYVRHCAGMAGSVVRGAENPLETLFPEGDFSLARSLYENSATMRYINQLAVSVLLSLAGALSPAGRLSILEVGAGTGGTTSSLLATLPPGSVNYVYSDVSDVFLDFGRERFGRNPDVDYRVFDMQLPIAGQGFEPESFDLIVSANAVHASRNLPDTLERLCELLRPGGMLMLVESTTHLDWFDISTGLIEGWQGFDDNLRTENPLLSDTLWREALLRTGFEKSGTWPESASPASVMGQHLVLGRKPGRSVPGEVSAAFSETAHEAHQPAMSLHADLAAALPDERRDMLRGYVKRTVCKVLGRSEDDPPAQYDRLMDIGMDSLMALRLRNLLSQGLSLTSPLPASLAFDHPTPDAIARFLEGTFDATQAKPDTSDESPPEPADQTMISTESVTDLSDEEIESLLNARFGQNGE
ncbi:acyltransferase domain-containing protein [Ruegeria sp. 2012CJ41-6]|uniref:Acyltransferase domain-containing protein n=1 Tax=Ruegeria spongiae TaxID=2942209 RepID=A0ABT0Q8E1_9RHOB|nr:type I polyketide synthase [Ruegeria spongiae]MCL6285139.1 acyltransferase domain-containing protein [Ruegeria spongiae]